ncbi:MAG TPA: NAD(P)/FAD-dependent oxidoreductase, partial [Chitinophagaceae bacterium]
IHGDLELTIRLLNEAGIKFHETSGDLWRSVNGRLEKQHDFIEDQQELIEKLKGLQHDMNVKEFLETYFSGEEYADLRRSLTSFVEGYDAADADHASCFALLQEMMGEEGANTRIEGGYMRLIDHLSSECVRNGSEIHLSTVVSSIAWKTGEVIVTTAEGKVYTAPRLIITLPVSILQLEKGSSGHVSISPLPENSFRAIQSLGSTGVIKVILQFKNAFWNQLAKTGSDKPPEIGFIFSDATIPTWWTQLPDENAMITGWLAGPDALKLAESSEDEILRIALESLSVIFDVDLEKISSGLIAHHIRNWTADPYTRGAYAYEKVDSKNAKRILNSPLGNTIYFAGEALFEGPHHGTVEGALQSGYHVAQLISQQSASA